MTVAELVRRQRLFAHRYVIACYWFHAERNPALTDDEEFLAAVRYHGAEIERLDG